MKSTTAILRPRGWLAAIGGVGLLAVAMSAPSGAGVAASQPAGAAPLAGWHSVGAASWRAEAGDIVGTTAPDGAGGWLVHDTPYQDVRITFSFRCSGECRPGVLLGMEQTSEQTKGLYVSFADGDLLAYDMTLDAAGRERAREKPAPPAAAPPRPPAAIPAAIADHPLSRGRPAAALRADVWNDVEVRLFTGINADKESLQVMLNGLPVETGFINANHPIGSGSVLGRVDRIGAQPEVGRFGPLALGVAGASGVDVRFRDVALKSFNEITPPIEKVSPRFRKQMVTPFFYGDGAAVGDLNRDGAIDIVTGPMYWLGPDFSRGREIDVTRPIDVTDYARALGVEVADFTGDGWPDVLATGWPGGSALYLYVNPQNALRRWPRYKIAEEIGEIFELADIDGDGQPEFVYTGGGYAANYIEPDPADATKPWIVHRLTEQGPWGSHGLGVGDVNGDGRLDVLRAWGWWENPGAGVQGPWPFHPAVLGRSGPAAGPGGAQMFAYDVNGDGLADVVTSLEAHGYGLAWFEQRRDVGGRISFTQHTIMDRGDAPGGVHFTEPHGLTLADVDGDGLLDIVTGKNKYNWGSYAFLYPDAEGDGVLYWFRLVRHSGGRVEYVPHLIHNNSGIGRQPRSVDLNGDGVLDVINNTRGGTFIFYGSKETKQ